MAARRRNQSTSTSRAQAQGLPFTIAFLAIVSASKIWFDLVNKTVPDPYLDEVFHVPQAQRYCRNDFSWDPKITTPPGLYLVSLLLKPVSNGCDTASLRALNAGAICFTFLLSYLILRALRHPLQKSDSLPFWLDAHSALNISLFPPLFFFSVLYYTDVMSTLVVLLTYYAFFKGNGKEVSFSGSVVSVSLGIAALFFRQTNIFWVAVFPAGLAVVNALKSGERLPARPTQHDFSSILKNSWSTGSMHDCSVRDAGPIDYVLLFCTLPLAAMRRPIQLLGIVTPYLVLLGIFAGFVAWNGGVVLGDKSAHVATIHLPQMLYFSPYLTFFSLPLVIGSLLPPVLRLLPGPLKAFCENYITGTSKIKIPSLISTVMFMACGLAAVRFNTIVHPYTLADNRHYVFYAFRILRRHPAIKYLAVPFYYICSWITIQALGMEGKSEAAMKRNPKTMRLASTRDDRQSCQISFVIIWIAITALSVVTAPLVEPRYFIIPWIIWRLHVPDSPALWPSDGMKKKTPYDLRLLLETLWLLAINAAIGYNFLYRGFSWPSEPGRVQRFLW